ncbi:VIT domain-containing protein [Magnetofaba australis]|uniref:VIT domain-containing protein n=1 Tax=Magnetofaba australis IT-1 TaxID=1434232 RepID=A0A1Y2K758_9PROT|nr:VIT domain-containing protein [Magnetofaba australis]OSM04192.1 hypothetical protein MAIT1_04047 [Magnetofaba australis IT-1]
MKISQQAKRWAKTALATAALAAALHTAAGDAQAAGLITPNGVNLPQLAIGEHKVSVVIDGGFAVTTVEQTFHNPHSQDLEALYAFPLPKHGALAEFTYWINGQPVTGEVMRKQQARALYEREKSAGRETALAQQEGFKRFETRVWPVRANDAVRVRLTYMQPVEMDAGVGRYLYPMETGGVDDAQMRFWSQNDAVSGYFSFDVTLRDGYPVTALRAPAHPGMRFTRQADGGWRAHMDKGTAASTAVEEAATAEAMAAVSASSVRLDTDVALYRRQ